MALEPLGDLSKDPLDYSQLNPGIRRTVLWLRVRGFETTDSGDGVTNVAAGMEGALPFPHVHMRSSPRALIDHARSLAVLLSKTWGINLVPVGHDGPSVQADYDPANGTAGIMLMHVDDALLRRHGDVDDD